MQFGSRFAFETKAQTLAQLTPLLRASQVPRLLNFTVDEWSNLERRGQILGEIATSLGGGSAIIRSSAFAEDSTGSAMAGVFESVGPVDPTDGAAVETAVGTVIRSYESAGSPSPKDRVLVQRMVDDVDVAGVVFTQDLSTGAPYYVINYDDESGATDTVTAGTGYTNRTLYVFRDAWDRITSRRFRSVVAAIREIEQVVGSINLDIEFALTGDGVVHIFQVRQITTERNWNRGQSLRIGDALRRVEEHLDLNHGNTPILGSMPDWNPAEMIGTTPRPLALSLYRRLITDDVWARARELMGYKRRPGARLLSALAGQPYIDVRESFWSLIPSDLDDRIGAQLVDGWLDRLRTHPHLHDKVEFDVALSAFAPDFDLRAETQCISLSGADLEVFRSALRSLTVRLAGGSTTPIKKQLRLIEVLERRRAAIETDYANPRPSTAAALIEDVLRYGTVPFAILARHAFIARSLVSGLVGAAALDAAVADRFQSNIRTVATDFIEDVRSVADGTKDRADVLRRYGHLRPGTYDLLSDRYDRRFSDATVPFASRSPAGTLTEQIFAAGDLARVDRALSSSGIDIEAGALFDYVREAVQGREYAKFAFTHNVSDLLEVIAAVGERHGLSREELTFIDVRSFLDVFVEPGGRTAESQLRQLAESGRERHRATAAIRLPSLITRPTDVWVVPLRVEQPNFITRGSARAPVATLGSTHDDPSAIDGRIVAISSADPGYDWIFTRPIAGLVTRFGGVNSHMAIRCAEFGIPAAIGCGEQIFSRVTAASEVRLNCADGQLVVV